VTPRHALPRLVWTLGFVSLLMDLSSEMIHGLLPVFLVSVLGTGAVTVGLVEGIAEATASFTRIFSGALSDWLGRRKPLLLAGYGLAALTKPLFALANSAGLVLTARFIDRVGKGVRGAPRDALVADATPAAARGAAYGLRQSLDTVGAFAAPLFAVALMLATGGNIRAVFWFAVIPAAACVLLIVVGVRDVGDPASPVAGQRTNPVQWSQLRRLPRPYWRVILFAGLLSLARFSEAFLLLRAMDTGLSASFVPLVLVVMNLFYAASAYPAGRLADRVRRRALLVPGMIALVLADAVLALAPDPWTVGLGAILWGLHMGATQGLLNAAVADTAPQDLRGTAFGVFHLFTGGALLLASVAAGWLWDHVGVPAPFAVSALLASLALAGLLFTRHNSAGSILPSRD